eukprot:853508-Amorphochlora_amoeboformis.AAC.1
MARCVSSKVRLERARTLPLAAPGAKWSESQLTASSCESTCPPLEPQQVCDTFDDFDTLDAHDVWGWLQDLYHDVHDGRCVARYLQRFHHHHRLEQQV